MTSQTRFIPPLALMLIGGAMVASVVTWLTLERRQNKGQQKAALNDWEDEGGSVPAPDVTAP